MQWAALVRVSPMHAEIQIVQYLDSFLKYANQSIENEAEREQKRTYQRENRLLRMHVLVIE